MSETFYNNEPIKRLIKVNSVDFVKRAFEFYQSRTVFMIDAEGDASNADLIYSDIDTVHPENSGGWFNFSLDPIKDDAPAQIIFSSGTEGRSKAIVISHATLANVVSRINNTMQLDASIREYIGAPVTYSFGLGRCRAIAAVGGHGYIPESGFDLREIQSLLESDQINAISAVPSLWRILLNHKELFGKLGKKIKWIEIGSQYMSADEKRAMKKLFPNANILQHYGLTEASRSTLLSISSVDEQYLESVGPINSDCISIQLDESQRIKIRGAHTSLGRILEGQLVPVTDDEGWLTTSDIGEIKDGYLYYRGRHDDIINCSGIKVDPEKLQQKVNVALKGQCTVSICGIPDQQRGEGFFIVSNSEHLDSELIRKTVNNELAKINISANDAVHIQYLENIPKTETGKVKRNELATLFEPASKRRADKVSSGNSILDAYQEIFVNQDVTIDSSFESLGGDSLNFVQLSISIEKILGHLPDNWEILSIAELETADSASNRSCWSTLETSILLRTMAILSVALNHSGLPEVGGGTFLLFLLIGANLARFQIKDLIAGKVMNIFPIYSVKVVIPYLVMAIAYSLIIGYFNPKVFLLIQNFWSVSWTIFFPFWFVQVLVQCMVLLTIIFSVPFFCRSLEKNPWGASFSLLVLLIFFRLIYPGFWDTAPQSNMVAPRFICYIWLGWTLYLSTSTRHKILTSIVGIAFIAYENTYIVTDEWYIRFVFWGGIGCLLLPSFKQIAVPRWVQSFSNYIAASTFYIFVFNGPVAYFNRDVLGIEFFVFNAICSVGLSVLLWYLFKRLNILSRAAHQLNKRFSAIIAPLQKPSKQ